MVPRISTSLRLFLPLHEVRMHSNQEEKPAIMRKIKVTASNIRISTTMSTTMKTTTARKRVPILIKSLTITNIVNKPISTMEELLPLQLESLLMLQSRKSSMSRKLLSRSHQDIMKQVISSKLGRTTSIMNNMSSHSQSSSSTLARSPLKSILPKM